MKRFPAGPVAGLIVLMLAACDSPTDPGADTLPYELAFTRVTPVANGPSIGQLLLAGQDGSEHELLRDYVRAIAWSPDGTHIAVSMADGTLATLEYTTKQMTVLGMPGITHRLLWAPNGRHIAGIGGDALRVITTSGTPVLSLEGVHDADWGPDGAELVVVRDSGVLSVVDLDGSERVLSPGRNALTARWTAPGQIHYISHRQDGGLGYVLRAVDPHGDLDVAIMPDRLSVSDVLASLPGTESVVVRANGVPGGNLVRVDLASQEIRPLAAVGNQFGELRASPDGSMVALPIAGVHSLDIWVYDTDSGAVVTALQDVGEEGNAAWRPRS